VDLVELDDVLVAVDQNAVVRRIVDEIVRGALSDAVIRMPADRSWTTRRNGECDCGGGMPGGGGASGDPRRAVPMPPSPVDKYRIRQTVWRAPPRITTPLFAQVAQHAA